MRERRHELLACFVAFIRSAHAQLRTDSRSANEARFTASHFAGEIERKTKSLFPVNLVFRNEQLDHTASKRCVVGRYNAGHCRSADHCRTFNGASGFRSSTVRGAAHSKPSTRAITTVKWRNAKSTNKSDLDTLSTLHVDDGVKNGRT